MKLTIALAQIPVTGDIAGNLETIRGCVDFAANHGADILLTPEGSLSGYTAHFNVPELDKALETLVAYASGMGIGLALGTCKVEDDNLCYNELRFYSKSGVFLGAHTKTLLCGTMEDEPKGEIEEFAVQPLRVFDFEGVCVGGLICNDMWGNPGCTPMHDPHLSHQLARMGTKVIFHAVNGGRDASEQSQVICRRFHEAHVLMQAGADKVHIATVDNSDPETIGVSSWGGVAGPGYGWLYQLPDRGQQLGIYSIDL